MNQDSGSYSVRQTYVALRWTILVVVIMLFAAVAYTGVKTGHWQTSISAYYYTAARPAFVAALCAIGACLILYHASNPENVILDVAGFLAFVVAFVPTTIDFSHPERGMINVPSAQDVAAGVRANVVALLFAGFAAVAVGWFLWRSETRSNSDGDASTHTGLALSGSLFALFIGTLIFRFASTLIDNHAHFVAAGTMFVLLLFVVMVNARRADVRTPPARFLAVVFERGEPGDGPYGFYVWIARLMLALALALGLLGLLGFEHWIFWVEAVLITLFALFWQRQTQELLSKFHLSPEESTWEET